MKKKNEERKEQERLNKLKAESHKEELTCNICLEIFYKPVSIIPCLHSFCGGCLSDWIKKSKECPHCRKQGTQVQKSHNMQNMTELFIKENPEEDRSDEEKKHNDDKDIFTHETYNIEQPSAAVPQRGLFGGLFGMINNNNP